MTKRLVSFAAMTALAVALLALPATAEVSLGRPGSVLVFPLFDSSPSGNTIITVTNTNDDRTICAGSLTRGGDITIIYYYFDGETWLCTDITEDLTPSDTLSVLTRNHNPNMERGFLIVQARDSETFAPVDFDYLLGSAIVVNSDFDFAWSYLPYSFEAQFTTSDERDRCGRKIIEDDGCIKFGDPDDEGSGVTYYDRFPDALHVERFFGEGTSDTAPTFMFSNRLVLLSSHPGFDEPEETRLSIVGFNNNERRFSRTFPFICWLETSLADITLSTTQGNLANGGDDEELNGVHTGWLKIQADRENVGILGVFVDLSVRAMTTFSAGNTIQFSFQYDGRDRGRDVKICCGVPF